MLRVPNKVAEIMKMLILLTLSHATYCCNITLHIALYGSVGMTNFSMEYSTLTANCYQAVYVSPMLSMIGIIKNTTFTHHKKGVILIDNTDNLQRNRVFLDKRVNYAIESNVYV